MNLMENELKPCSTDTRTDSWGERCYFIGTGVILLHFYGSNFCCCCCFNQFRVLCGCILSTLFLVYSKCSCNQSMRNRNRTCQISAWRSPFISLMAWISITCASVLLSLMVRWLSRGMLTNFWILTLKALGCMSPASPLFSTLPWSWDKKSFYSLPNMTTNNPFSILQIYLQIENNVASLLLIVFQPFR